MVRDYSYNLQGSVTAVKESRWDGGLSGTQKYVYTTRYNYDVLGVRLESVVYPDGETLYLTYDAQGRLYCKSSEKDEGWNRLFKNKALHGTGASALLYDRK